MVTGYLGDPDSLPAAFDGVERMYLAPLPETLDLTLDLITQARVEYGVALSGTRIGRPMPIRVASGLHARFRTHPSVVEAPISMDDIARVAAGLLVEPMSRTTAGCIRLPVPSR